MIYRYFTTVIILSLTFFISTHVSGAKPTQLSDTADYYSDDFLRNDNHVYQKYIKSVEVTRVAFDMADPLITLYTDERFRISFDDLQGSFKQYYYQLQHCNADWAKSEIWMNEFIEGDEEGQVEKFESSFNTRTTYTHYEFVFPNDRLIIKKSGNYIVRVYSRDEREMK